MTFSIDREIHSVSLRIMTLPVGVESLPLDAIEYITNYLSVSELSHCCAVNRTWRDIFGNNIFWKKHCNKKCNCNYLKNTTCQIQTKIDFIALQNSSLSPIGDMRLCYMREKQLQKNWKTGFFIKNEIEFDCDDSISYNIQVNFVENDYVFLHTTFQTEVWDVKQQPNLKMTIPFKLKEMWENNLYTVVENRLVIVQCNVAQVFQFHLNLNNYYFSHAFFFNQPQEYSSKITNDTDIDEMFQMSSFSIAEDVVRVVSGDYLVGFVTSEEYLKNPVIHIWNIKTGEKVKESISPAFHPVPHDISLKVSESVPNKILVFFETSIDKKVGSNTVLFDLDQMKFDSSNQYYHYGDSLLWNDILCVLCNSKLVLIDFGKKNTKLKEYSLNYPYSMKIFNGNLIIGSRKEVLELKPPENRLLLKPLEIKFSLDFTCSDLYPIYDRFLAIHDMECNVREIWEVGNPSVKVLSFPEDTGTYRAVNEACTRIVLERANTLIVLSFW